MRVSCFLIASSFVACALVPRLAAAQRVGFFAPAGTGFDPEISVVNSGALLDAQAVVSNDMKYVTINARPSNSNLLALREFSFARNANVIPPLGFVGGAGAGNAAIRNVLDRPGMRRVATLSSTP
jgi:hypothetical protein